MAVRRSTAAALRAEGRLLALAGVMLLCLGFPLTLYLVALALAPNGVSPVLPVAVGAPPIVMGYIACHFASLRMVRAKALGKKRRR
jgi:hypothetical protein